MRISWLLLYCGMAGAACQKGAPRSPTALPAIEVVPGLRDLAPPTSLLDVDLAPSGAWRVAVAHRTASRNQVEIINLQTPDAAAQVVEDAQWAALDPGRDSILVAAPPAGADASRLATLPELRLSLVDATGGETCGLTLEGTGRMTTSAMAASEHGLAWSGEVTGALRAGAHHVTASQDGDAVVVLMSRTCEVTGVSMLAGPDFESVIALSAWPGRGAEAQADWLIIGRFATRALLATTPLDHRPVARASARRGGTSHSMVAAVLSPVGEVQWTTTLSSTAPLFAAAVRVAPSGERAAIAGTMRGGAVIVDGGSERELAATAAAGDGFVWELGRNGMTKAISRMALQEGASVAGLVARGEAWHVLVADASGGFVARAGREAWDNILRLEVPTPAALWLAPIVASRTLLLVSYDGKNLRWQGLDREQ
ncbi:MAG: hypothetical protein IPL79_04420 [Myxococcales bacterium]|nr:hypothetical protein [Myxococcales bacterium]